MRLYVASRAAIILTTVVLALGGCGSDEEVAVKAISASEDGIAVGGYDVVSYFDGGAQKGTTEHSTEWNGATFHFASGAHRDAFTQDPERYIPQYGGYCSFGMGFGKAATADPEAFIVQDDKLHLNASPMVLRFWRWFGNSEKSEAKWQALRAEAGI